MKPGITDEFSKLDIGLIIYGSIGIFVGPLLVLGVFGDTWRIFAGLEVIIFLTALASILFELGKAFGLALYWPLLLAILVTGIFFWRPAADIISGEQVAVGSLVLDEQEDIYIMSPYSYNTRHNIRYRAQILTVAGEIYNVRLTPSQFEKWNEIQQSCGGETQFTFLKNMRKVLAAVCINNLI